METIGHIPELMPRSRPGTGSGARFPEGVPMPRCHPRIVAPLAVLVSLLAVLSVVTVVAAQEKPRMGGELVFVVPSSPPSYDAHREETFGTIHPIAPHYNTLLRTDPTDRLGAKVIGDLAESWTISKDQKT